MHVIDLSHTVVTDMPVYPGDDGVSVQRVREIGRDGYSLTNLCMSTHSGTHVDIAAHMHAEAPAMDWLGPANFAGWGAVLDLTHSPNRFIDADDFAPLAGMEGLDFILIRTGWDAKWGAPEYFRDHKYLTPTACRYLAGLDIKGIGMDFPSPDPLDSRDFAAHRLVLGAGLVAVENLANLGELPSEGFVFTALPLKIAGGDGSPVRAAAIVF